MNRIGFGSWQLVARAPHFNNDFFEKLILVTFTRKLFIPLSLTILESCSKQQFLHEMYHDTFNPRHFSSLFNMHFIHEIFHIWTSRGCLVNFFSNFHGQYVSTYAFLRLLSRLQNDVSLMSWKVGRERKNRKRERTIFKNGILNTLTRPCHFPFINFHSPFKIPRGSRNVTTQMRKRWLKVGEWKLIDEYWHFSRYKKVRIKGKNEK